MGREQREHERLGVVVRLEPHALLPIAQPAETLERNVPTLAQLKEHDESLDLMNALCRWPDPPPPDRRWEKTVAAACEVAASHKADALKLREAALTLAATATLLLRDRALLLPPEQEKWEAACGRLNRLLG